MFKDQQANITFELASEHLNAHNSRENRPKYLMPGYYLNENFCVSKPVEYIKLNELSFDELWQKRRDEMKSEVVRNGKTKLVDIERGKKPLKQNCHYECVIGLNEHTSVSSLLRSIKAVGEILNIEPINVYIHSDEGHLLRKCDNKEIYPLFRDENGKLGGTYVTDTDGRAYYIHIKENKKGEQYYEKGAELRYDEFEPMFQRHAHVEWNTLVSGRNQMQRFKRYSADANLDAKTVFKNVYNTNAEILGMKKGSGNSKHKKLKEFRVASENEKLASHIEELKSLVEQKEAQMQSAFETEVKQRDKIRELAIQNEGLKSEIKERIELYAMKLLELLDTKDELALANETLAEKDIEIKNLIDEISYKDEEIMAAREEIEQIKEQMRNIEYEQEASIKPVNTKGKSREMYEFGI